MTERRVTQDIPFAIIPRWVVQALGLDASALAVYVGLSAYASSDRQAYPSIRRLARDLGCSPTTIQSALKRLEKSGAVIISRRFVGKERTSNLYHLPFNPMVGMMAAASHLGGEV